jgi:hypothetical protein
MATRAKYKVKDYVEFWFAGSAHNGSILEVRKDGNKVSYMIQDVRQLKYPVEQDKVTKKL